MPILNRHEIVNDRIGGRHFAVNNEAPDSYHPKTVGVGLNIDGVYRAYPFVELERHGKARFCDSINGARRAFARDAENRSVSDDAGNPVAAIQSFCFAWFAFHPATGFSGPAIPDPATPLRPQYY